MAILLAVANLKGGVSKSTIAVNLACELAAKQVRVVLIDADAQATSAHYAAQGQLPIHCEPFPLDDPKAVDRWVQRVLAIQADFVVLDSPPHVGAVAQAIIGISDLVIVPCTASSADLMATVPTVELIKAARAARSDKGPKCLLVPSRVDRRTTSGREIEQAMKTFGEPIGPAIHQRAAFVDAFTSGQWIGEYAPNSDAHADITALAKRVKQISK